MIRFLLALFVIGCLNSCKKVQEVKEDKAMDFITNGQWKVAILTKGSTDYSSSFAPYIFQFKTDGKVTATSNGVVTSTGTWEGNMTSATIKSNFPATATQPLPLLNGTWQIIAGGLHHTVATKTENGETSNLRLEKP